MKYRISKKIDSTSNVERKNWMHLIISEVRMIPFMTILKEDLICLTKHLPFRSKRKINMVLIGSSKVCLKFHHHTLRNIDFGSNWIRVYVVISYSLAYMYMHMPTLVCSKLFGQQPMATTCLGSGHSRLFQSLIFFPLHKTWNSIELRCVQHFNLKKFANLLCHNPIYRVP